MMILPDEKIAEILLAGVLSLAGTYAGARAAFSWNRRHEKDKALDAKVEALNRAMHILSRQYSMLSSIRRHHIEPKRNDPFRHFQMPPLVPPDYRRLTVDTGSLVFLYTTSGREVPHIYALEGERFESAMQAIELRFQIHRGEFQQRIKELGSVDLSTGRAVEKAVGPLVTASVKNATDHMIKQVDAALKQMEIAGSKIPTLAKEALGLKDKRLLGFLPRTPDPEPDSPPAPTTSEPGPPAGSP